MRNPLDKSSVAQSLDGDRLMGSLHFPATVSRLSAAHTQQERYGSKYHEAVRAAFFRSVRGTKASVAPCREHFQRRETNMKIAKIIFASAAAIPIICSGALAQQALTGSITKVDELNGKITIQQTQSGTVGANTGGAADDFKVQDGLLFNSLQTGDKVVFTATEIGGVKTITKLQKQ
jgi:Cu/Ag efflux protein CusF